MCIVVRLLWLRVFACKGVLLSESSVVTCESRPLYLTLPAWGSVSLRRGVGCAWACVRKNYLLTYFLSHRPPRCLDISVTVSPPTTGARGTI